MFLYSIELKQQCISCWLLVSPRASWYWMIILLVQVKLSQKLASPFATAILLKTFPSKPKSSALYAPRSLISIFVIWCLDRIMRLVSISEISSLYLDSVTAKAGLSLPSSQTSKTGFLVTRLICIGGFHVVQNARYVKRPKCVRVETSQYRTHFSAFSCSSIGKCGSFLSRLMTKPTKWLCAQRRIRSAWASVQFVQSLRCALNGYLRTPTFFMRTAKTDQTGQMVRLIWVFAERTCHFVGFVIRRPF